MDDTMEFASNGFITMAGRRKIEKDVRLPNDYLKEWLAGDV
jgi:hypothetical protein